MTQPAASFRPSSIVLGAALGAAFFFTGFDNAVAQSGGGMPGMENMEGMAGMQHGASGESFPFGEPGTAGTVDRTINITMKDITFDPAAVQVKTGETIRFVVTNRSEGDHDFTIGDVEAQTAHRKEMAEMMERGMEMHHDDDPNAVSVEAGETGTLIWKFTHAGSFEFDCNIPGHYEAGMKGVITVSGTAAPH
jgi:uncharacterized cupredoxin-like copper-binding protein